MIRFSNFYLVLVTEAGNTYQKKSASEKDHPSTSGEAKAANDEIISVLNTLSSVTNKVGLTHGPNL